MNQRAPARTTVRREGAPPIRWECHCWVPAVLLGTYSASGRVNIKVRDRYWHVEGRVWAQCHRCGVEHFLDSSANGDAGS